jgi:hypothetical protein
MNHVGCLLKSVTKSRPKPTQLSERLPWFVTFFQLRNQDLKPRLYGIDYLTGYMLEAIWLTMDAKTLRRFLDRLNLVEPGLSNWLWMLRVIQNLKQMYDSLQTFYSSRGISTGTTTRVHATGR